MTTALEGGEGSASRPGRSCPTGKSRYPLYRRLGGTQGRSGQVRKISPPPGFDLWTVQPAASRYTDWAIPAHKQIIRVKKNSLGRLVKNYVFPAAESCHRESKTLRPSCILDRLPARRGRSVSSLNSRQPCTISISESVACFTRKLSLRQLKRLTMEWLQLPTAYGNPVTCTSHPSRCTVFFIALLTNESPAAHNIQ